MNAEPSAPPKLRLWPGVVAAVPLVLVAFVAPMVVPGSGGTAILGGVGGGLAVTVWWLFFSRAPWSERVGAVVLMVAAVVATRRIVHPSIATAGQGMLLYVFGIPVLSLALVVWAVASQRLSSGPRRASLLATILLACGVFTLLRTGGVTGDGGAELHWRWTETPEQRLLARAEDEPAAPASAPPAAETHDRQTPEGTIEAPKAPASAPTAAGTLEKRAPAPAADDATPRREEAPSAKTDADWPGFRGRARDGIVHGVQIRTDWAASPPLELWRRPIGPGWSSFAVHGDRLFTQEQRGEEEIVACYDARTGEPVWKHRDAARFWESNGGPGPRGTPSLSRGRVYTFGATGIVNALDAADGSVVWTRNAAADTGAKVPYWGFSSSPLVVDDVVIVAASGRLVAYDLATGDPRWLAPTRPGSYSSPHLSTIDGVAQIILLRGGGATSVSLADGTPLWEHTWPQSGAIVQPALTADGDVLISTNNEMGGLGTRRLAVAHGPAGWTVEERWTSNGLKPYFNDFVVHEGHAFGFDGSILACIDLADGRRKWKGGRYGHGQLVLLADQDVLLVLSEDGELALVGATPDRFSELARFPAIDGKTWNHPVLSGDVLLVRNGEQMAAFRLSLAGR